MQRHDAIKALEIYKLAGKQAERLAEFYESCKSLSLGRSFQFPTLEQVSSVPGWHSPCFTSSKDGNSVLSDSLLPFPSGQSRDIPNPAV